MTAREVAFMFAVDPGTVNRWVKEGRIKAFRTPGGQLPIPQGGHRAVQRPRPRSRVGVKLTGVPVIGFIGGPLTGVASDNAMHAFTLETKLAANGEHPRTVCGESDVPFWLISDGLVPWPPQHKLPAPYTRCRECWISTGKKRPASRFERKTDVA